MAKIENDIPFLSTTRVDGTFYCHIADVHLHCIFLNIVQVKFFMTVHLTKSIHKILGNAPCTKLIFNYNCVNEYYLIYIFKLSLKIIASFVSN